MRGAELGVGVWMSQRRADAVLERLAEGEVFPARAQVRIDQVLEEIVTTAIDTTDEMATAAEDLRHARKDADLYTLEEVITWAVVGVVIGGALTGGIAIGYQVSR